MNLRHSATTALRTLRYLARHPLGRSAPARVLGRYVRWQAHQAVSRRPMRFRTVGEAQMNLWPHSHGLTKHYYLGLGDFEEQAFALHLLRPGDLLADVGANVGVWTVLAAARGARVEAFEPVASAHARLVENVALNPFADQVRVHEAAVGETEGSLLMTTALDAGNHVVNESDETDGAGPLVRVPVVTLDDALGEAEDLRLIKLDVEGWEVHVVRGAARTLARPGLLALVVETFRPVSYDTPNLRELEARLAAEGFLPYRYETEGRRLVALERIEEGTDNTIYVRDRDAVEQRLRAAPAIRVGGRWI